MSKKILILLLIWVLHLTINSCTTKHAVSETNASKIAYKGSVLDAPGETIIVIEAISNSGRRIIRTVESGMTLYFKGSPGPFADHMYLETLQDPKAQYSITDDEWTAIIRIRVNSEQLESEISAIRFNLDSGNGDESVTVTVDIKS